MKKQITYLVHQPSDISPFSEYSKMNSTLLESRQNLRKYKSKYITKK